MSDPKVSVVIPTHNRPDFVVRAIESVLAQTYNDYEIIVVDDGDDPSARRVIEKFLTLLNFTYLETKKNEGAPVARNVGIKAARGEYVAFLDDDDEWVSEKLFIQMKRLKDVSYKAVFVFSAITTTSDNGKKTCKTSVFDGVKDFHELSLVRYKGFLTSSLVVKRDTLLSLGGFDKSFPAGQEADLIIRLSKNNLGLGIDKALVNMRHSNNDDHIGGDVSRRIRAREMLLEKHKELYRSRPKIHALQLFRLSLFYRRANRYKDAIKSLTKSLKLNFSLRVVYHLLINYLKWSVHSITKK